MATHISAEPAPDSPLAAAGDGALAEPFTELEARVRRVAEALQQTRAERDQARAQGDGASTELTTLRAAHEKLQQAHSLAERELVSLRKERNDVRQRVGKLVAQLETSLT